MTTVNQEITKTDRIHPRQFPLVPDYGIGAANRIAAQLGGERRAGAAAHVRGDRAGDPRAEVSPRWILGSDPGDSRGRVWLP